MTPKTNDAVLVAQALNTTVEYLVTGISADSQSLSPQEMKLFQIVKGLSPEKLQDIIVIAGAFSDKPTEEAQYMKTKMDQFNSK